ncbi:MAG: laccase domain-containing protein [Acidobacteria bacterium]|nr:laccase domain-containing protein [Acidobacteriota bacterium]
MSVALTLATPSRDGLPRFELDAMREFGVDAFVTGRGGGVSTAPYEHLNLALHVGDDPRLVAENRRRVAAAARVAPSHLVTSHQVHGATVNDLDHWRAGPLEGDALVTTRDDVALCVLVADCVPLLFVDPTDARVAVAHAGWRGLVAGVIPATLAHFARANEVRVVVGPHISSARYQIGPEVARHFSDVDGACHEDQGDRQRLDLGVVTRHQLRRGGVLDEHVTSCTPYTDDGGVFFSDRAQRPCGRFGLVARRATYDATRREGTP